jgi:hypothetical protein
MGVLAVSLAGCSSLATFLADNIPDWAGGLPKDAPPRAGDPRYAEYFKAQIAAQQSVEQRKLADAKAREQNERIERAQTEAGLLESAHSARSMMREAAAPAEQPRTEKFLLSGRALY